MKIWKIFVVSLLAGGAHSTALAIDTNFNDKVEFLLLANAKLYTDPYSSDANGQSEFESKFLTISNANGGSLIFSELVDEFAGNEMVVSGDEDLNIDIVAPVSSLGWEMSDPNGPSIFQVKFLRKGEVVKTEFIDTLTNTEFFGFWSDTPFDRVEIRETLGNNENEIFGRFYGGLGKNRDQSSNAGALLCQAPLLFGYNFATVASFFAPSPADHGYGLTAFATNLALKACKPWALAPADIITYADNPNDPNPNSAAACFKSFEHKRVHSGYTNLFGIPVDYSWDWGPLGTPQVVHANTDVEVYMLRDIHPPETDTLKLSSLLGDELAAGGIYSECDDVKERGGKGLPLCPYAEDRVLKFGVGRNTQTYRFDVNMGILDLVYIWAPKFPQGTKNKALLDTALDLLLFTAELVWDVALGGWRFGNYADRTQQIIVYDVVAPTIAKASGDFDDNGVINGADQAFIENVTIEADEIGGVSRFRYQGFLRTMWDASDACSGSTGLRPIYPDDNLRVFWPVSTTESDTTFELTWEASDSGPNEQGLSNVTTITQMVSVVDTRPPVMQPPMDIVELTDEASVTLDLGQPLVFDLVDLDPVITNDAQFPLSAGLHVVTWTATDASGNTSEATQNVTIKNNNQEPSALAQTGGMREHAVSFEPEMITVTGIDPDNDLLNFFIEDYPQDGFFVAPLYPFFIEDYRLEANIDDDAIADDCVDRHLGGQGQAPYHLEQIRNPKYFSVLDDGTTYVMDYGYIRCQADLGKSPRYELRIAAFAPGGAFTNALDYSSEPKDLYVDSRTDLVYTTNGTQSNGSVVVLDRDLNPLKSYNLFSLPDQNAASDDYFFNGNIEYALASVLDSKGVLYVLDTLGDIYAVRADTEGENPVRPEFIGIALQTSNQGTNFDMAIDSEDNLYVSMDDRIYKVSAATVDENGDFVVGSLVGWMGKCTVDLAPGDLAVCDVANERTLGYSCTDEYCPDANYSGDMPGQFNDPRGIAIDPRDNLYVTDYQNFRVQRFTPDGFFAGQAESACDGSCFVLGDFGRPHDIAVNSDHFFILDPDTDLLHISQTSPFNEIGDDFATLEYQSNNDFACTFSADCVDSFSFSVSDGVRDPDTGQMMRSAPAVVEIEVERNFRAPFATPGIAVVVPEEVPSPILLDGSDPDPLDSLVFEITREPANGLVVVNGNIATYTSDVDYVGDDSFEFTVDDGVFTSAPELVELSVTDVNDPPAVGFDKALLLGRGFEVRITGDVSDPDPLDVHTLMVKWGDGSPDEAEGKVDMSGITGPIIMGSPAGTGRVLADHVFENNGIFDVEFCVTDRVDDSGETKQPTADSLTACHPIAAEVIDMVDVTIDVSGIEALTRGESADYTVNVANLAPASGPGLTATGLELSIMVDSLLLSAAPSGCTKSGNVINCLLDDLPPGGSTSLNLPVIVPGDTGSAYEVNSEFILMVNEPDISEVNIIRISTPLLEQSDFPISGMREGQLQDLADTNPGDGECKGVGGQDCNLRAAVMESNFTDGKQVIALGNQVFTLTAEENPEAPPSSFGDIDVNDDLKIVGNGPDNTFISAGQIDRLFKVGPGVTLELEGLSLTGGKTLESGGAILVDVTGRLLLKNVRIYENESDGNGGAIFHTNAETGSLVIENSVISGNVATAFGGAIYASAANLVNTTLSNNTAVDFWGGGLNAIGEVNLVNVTFNGNSAQKGGGFVVNGGALTMTNTLLGNNHAPEGPDCALGAGSLVSGGGNLVQDKTDCVFTLATSDQVNVPSGILELRDNGGGTRTHGLIAGSKAIDKALNSACPLTDQRGEPRPVDGVGNGQPRCDVGAFEANSVTFMELIFISSFD